MLWALGLVQESKVLGEGPIQQYAEDNPTENPIDGYASTGGWTLGSKPVTELYNSARLIALTPEQDELIYRVAENIFRPCCGNHTAFPDCNHGMAVLGLELMASQGATEDELYQAALAFNTYAFTDSYIRVAAYFTMQDVPWSEVSARQILGPDYSSGQGARRIASAVGPPGSPASGSCGAYHDSDRGADHSHRRRRIPCLPVQQLKTRCAVWKARSLAWHVSIAPSNCSLRMNEVSSSGGTTCMAEKLNPSTISR
jgi:hypothetical protein